MHYHFSSTKMISMADFLAYFLIFLISVVFAIGSRKLSTKLTKPKLHLPPSPPSLPILGNLHLLGQPPHRAFHKLSTKYGPLVHLKLGSVPCIVASEPEIVKELLKVNEISFSNRPKIAAIDYLTYGSADFSFSPYGEYWKFMRKMCVTELFSSRSLDALQSIRRDEINLFLKNIQKSAEAGQAMDIRGELITVTNNIISRMSMNKRYSDCNNEAYEVRKLVKESGELCAKFNLSDYFWILKSLDVQGFEKKLKKIRDRFDTMMETIMKEHKEARKKDVDDRGNATRDLLDILLDIAEDDSSEIRLSRENIKASMLDIFSGGTDTTSNTLEWTLAELINHPNAMQKMRQEIDSVVGKKKIATESDIQNLPYLQATIKESLRLHPPSPLLMRESIDHCVVGGYDIPAKTRLFVNVWALGRDPKCWENPLEFRPERFLNKDGSIKNHSDERGQNFNFLPFGTGRRGCPGASLALNVAQPTLAAMIQCFDWKVGDDSNGALIDMEEGPGSMLSKAHPLICVPATRFDPFKSSEIS